MKQQKQDRRSLRTRQLVSDALMALMRERRYSEITVQDLLDRAGIGRSTFYTHYFDKDDALAGLAEQMLEGFRQGLTSDDAAQRLIPSLALFQHAWEQRAFFEAMTRGRVGEQLWEATRALLTRNVEQALTRERPAHAPASVPAEVVAQYLAGAFLALFRWWLEAETPYSPEEMDSMFQRLSAMGVSAALGASPHMNAQALVKE